MKETWRILNALINKKQKGSEYPTQFNDNTNKVTGNENIANGFNKFFSNIGPALARNIPKCNTNFTHYLKQKQQYVSAICQQNHLKFSEYHPSKMCNIVTVSDLRCNI